MKNITEWKNENLTELSENELCELETVGKNPWHPKSNPMEVWAWDEKKNEVLIGTALPFEIVTYEEAREIFSA